MDQFAGEFLFGPVGVWNYAFPHSWTGDVVCHGDIHMTPRDMAKFGYPYLNGGTWGGQRILSEEWIEKSVSPKMSVRNWHLYSAEDYGYLWWLKEYTDTLRLTPTWRHYSAASTVTGSTLSARSAGSRHATEATTAKNGLTKTNVAASVGC